MPTPEQAAAVQIRNIEHPTGRTLAGDAGSQDGGDLIAAQYAGPKAPLKPIYDALLAGLGGKGSRVCWRA